MTCDVVKKIICAASTAAMLGVCVPSRGQSIEELCLTVPVYQEVRTHIHRPTDMKPGEKLPALLLVTYKGGCEHTRSMLASRRIVCIHFCPLENIPEQFRGWEEAYGHAGQDAIAQLLRHLLQMPEVDKDNIGIATISFGIVGATGALARHPDLKVKYLIDWEGPSGPQNLKWVPAGNLPPGVRNHPADDTDFWRERTASEFIKNLRCRYLRIQAETDHVQVAGKNQHAIELLNNATANGCPWTRCNENQPNQIYDEQHSEKEGTRWLPGSLSLDQAHEMIFKYVGEMMEMPPL